MSITVSLSYPVIQYHIRQKGNWQSVWFGISTRDTEGPKGMTRIRFGGSNKFVIQKWGEPANAEGWISQIVQTPVVGICISTQLRGDIPLKLRKHGNKLSNCTNLFSAETTETIHSSTAMWLKTSTLRFLISVSDHCSPAFVHCRAGWETVRTQCWRPSKASGINA